MTSAIRRTVAITGIILITAISAAGCGGSSSAAAATTAAVTIKNAGTAKSKTTEAAGNTKETTASAAKTAVKTADSGTAQGSSSDLSKFTTEDIDENPVTQDIFRGYDVTMVNIWATWCGPCMSEVPEIQSITSRLPEGTQIISICTDAADNPDAVKEIAKQYGLTYKILKVSDSLNNGIMKAIYAYPTTVFVNSRGEILGRPLMGVPRSNPGETYLKLLKQYQAEAK